jgi:Tfp pilus assembly protein PilF
VGSQSIPSVNMEQQMFTIPPSAFDVTLLPANARNLGTPAFHDAVSTFLQSQFQGFGGRVTILVDDQRIAVKWSPDATRHKPLEVVVSKLQQGQRAEGIQLLELLLSRQPDDVDLLYNLGIALSDAGKLEAAERHLRRATELAPRFANGLIALGVALSRQQKNTDALEALESAVELEPENPWARRNYGVNLLKMRRHEEAAEQLRRAVALQPDDQGTWLALGNSLRLMCEAKEAEMAYSRAIALNPHSDFAEAARQGSTQLAQVSFDNKTSGQVSQHAVLYCIAAIKEFSGMSNEQVQAMTFEIAVLGRNGFDVKNAEKKYLLKSKAGEFTGLQLVCYMYAGFQRISPGADVGFDLSQEYTAAKAQVEGGG